jgi:hypothetical protein
MHAAERKKAVPKGCGRVCLPSLIGGDRGGEWRGNMNWTANGKMMLFVFGALYFGIMILIAALKWWGVF